MIIQHNEKQMLHQLFEIELSEFCKLLVNDHRISDNTH